MTKTYYTIIKTLVEPESKDFFDDFARSEKIYLKFQRRQHKTQLFNEFKYKRKLFDR